VINWLFSLLAAVTLVAAWHYPGSAICAALGWTSLPLFYSALRLPKSRYIRIYVAGLITYTGGFFWLLSTIRDFGGMELVPALAVFSFYVAASAIQFLIWAFSFTHLPEWCSRWGLRTAVSWLIAHHCWIKIFPWDFGHTQLGFVPFAQLAGILGVTGITFVMMWLSEALCARRRVAPAVLPMAICVLGASLGYGVWIQQTINSLTPNTIPTLMIQGNVSLKQSHGMTFFSVSREQYLRTSAAFADKDLLIIWPESSITDLIPDATKHVSEAGVLPHFGDGSAFLVGGITYLSEREYFNSSILTRPDGSVDEPYHKTILMPFGEYTPMSDWFPWLQEINHTAGNFIAGNSTKVMSYKLSDGRLVKLSPLICYEDLVPRLAQQATKAGAELLINQSSDVWFGNTVAPYQHHMIASFRAIENRRFLLRSTSTGVTGVVDPLGRTLASLLPYTEATLPMEVSLINYQSTFTRVPVTLIWFVLASISALMMVFRALGRARMHKE
jgi:apolipoprotein N-acyltransferase